MQHQRATQPAPGGRATSPFGGNPGGACLRAGLVLVFLTLIGFSPSPAALAATDETAMLQAISLLKAGDFEQVGAAVDLLAESGDERAPELLKALLEGGLFFRKEDALLVIGEKEGRQYRISDALGGEALGTAKKSALEKVRINNSLRGRIRAAMAAIDLRHPDPARRLAAVEEMLDKLDEDNVALLRRFAESEADPKVREVMDMADAVADLAHAQVEVRLQAVERIGTSLHPQARNRLATLLETEPDTSVRENARKALKQIQFKADLYGLAETVFFGLSLGSVLVLAAIGLAITFGVMGVINMAHGELIMLGAYTTYVIQQLLPNHIGASLFLSIPLAFVVAGLVGILIERSVIRFLYGRPLETLLATFGISLVLQQTVRSIFSPLNRSVETPAWMSGSLEINSVLSLTLNRMYILAFSLLVFAALYLVLKKTPLGLQVRAVSQNRAMARAMGVRSEWVDAMTFGLGSGIAGVAGVALSQLTNVGPNLGQAYIIDSFMVVVFGGVGNLWGTLVGGLSLGVANKFLEPWSGAVLAKILVLVFIILFIQKRPRGLFPQKGRAAEG